MLGFALKTKDLVTRYPVQVNITLGHGNLHSPIFVPHNGVERKVSTNSDIKK